MNKDSGLITTSEITSKLVNRRDLLKSSVLLSIQSIIWSASAAWWLWFPIDPINKPLWTTGYRNWTNPTWTSVNNAGWHNSKSLFSDNEYIQSEASSIISFIAEKKYTLFGRITKNQFEEIIKKLSEYLLIIRNNQKSIEFFSFLEQFLKLSSSQGLSDEESVFLLQTYSHLDLLPRNFRTSNWDQVKTDKIFGDRFSRGYDNRELLRRINIQLKSGNRQTNTLMK